eukprot:CAMPEP_0114651658 /NCGR_PEP_ID=MMETSP0191-20121206/8480_1 /TAXON_ID=126664 /ORGANISM="Sorites sp." /LENGTH=30 /DNA_ID= /DNA_START= /DNA_END= /DNA_ORIENTATION=
MTLMQGLAIVFHDLRPPGQWRWAHLLNQTI